MTDVVLRARDILLAAEDGRDCGELPALTVEQAYRVQAAVLAAHGVAIGGWKVTLVDGQPAAAPIAASAVSPSVSSFAVVPGRVTRIETELAFRLGRDLPPSPIPYERADILAAIADIRAAFEIVRARLGEPPAAPFAAFLADRLGNAGLVIGGAAAGGGTTAPQRGVLTRDGREVASGHHPHGDPLAGLLAWANRQQDSCGGLRAGQFVITGSFTGAPAVEPGGTYQGSFDGGASVAAAFRSGIGT